jgi:hypothetical protein
MKPFRLVVCATFVIGLLAVGSPAAADVTVGQFVQQLAADKQLDARTPISAVAALATAGTPVPTNLNLTQRLTEGDVVEIARALGLRVNTSRPRADFGRVQIDRFLSAFAVELGTVNLRDDDDDQDDDEEDAPFDPFSKGKGKGKQVATETEP